MDAARDGVTIPTYSFSQEISPYGIGPITVTSFTIMPPLPSHWQEQPTQESEEKPRKERLSLNVYDLARLDWDLRSKLLQGKLDLENLIWVDRNDENETGILLTVPLLTAATICDIIRSEDRRNHATPTRVYMQKTPDSNWYKLWSNVLFTIVEDGKVLLNPSVFPYIPIALVPLEGESFSVGKKMTIRKGNSFLCGD